MQDVIKKISTKRTMDLIRSFGDKRQMAACVYCGCATESRDHIPPKVFLDEPFPGNLHIVPACQKCNIGNSLDEEYISCLLECITEGVENVENLSRQKIKNILMQKPLLASRIFGTSAKTGTGVIFKMETERVKKVILKLAKGHAAYELNEPQYSNPSKVTLAPLISLTSKDREYFETPIKVNLLPEVGSRAMQRMIIKGNDAITPWTIVQPGRYRYLATVGQNVLVRLVIHEYLACEVIWGKEEALN